MKNVNAFVISIVIICLSLLQYSSKYCKAENCPPTSCGSITDIRFPFGLTGDPKHCGAPGYQLSCENNRTILYIGLHRLFVQSISYNDMSILVFDPTLENLDCASSPINFLPDPENSEDPYILPYPDYNYGGTISYGSVSLQSSLNHPVLYISCEAPVKSVSNGLFINTSFCSKKNYKYSYFTVSHLFEPGNLADDCTVNWIAWISNKSPIADNASFSDIQCGLAYGFDLSWGSGLYCSICEASGGTCHFDYYHRTGVCLHFCSIYHPGTLRPTRKCLGDLWSEQLFKLKANHWIPVKILALSVPGILAARFFGGFLFLFTLLAYRFRRRHLSMYDNIEEFLQSHNNFMPIRYSYREIKNMTKNFKDKLGEGGYGTVYKGQLRSRPFVAVKVLGKSKASGQEFISEVATIGRIHHVNIVRLIGFCVQGSKRALVYEFMPNGSLEKYIFPQEVTASTIGGSRNFRRTSWYTQNIKSIKVLYNFLEFFYTKFPKKFWPTARASPSLDPPLASTNLSYSKMFEIALGVAKGIDYLHKGCDMQILHFDIKPHNILLDHDFNPKISDFGLAKLYPMDESMISITAARGTMGYMAPEMFYRNIGKVSYKSDVYSFGMLLMEMASKRKNLNPYVEDINQIYFPCWIHDRFSKGIEIDLEDASLDERVMVKKMALVALWCIQMKPGDRPSMTRVIEMLEGDVNLLQLPPRPFLSLEEMPVEETNTDINDNVELPLLSSNLENQTNLHLH